MKKIAKAPAKRKDAPDFDTAIKNAGADTLTIAEKRIITASAIQLPVGHLSPTAIEMYLRCPTQYERRYVQGIKSPPAAPMMEGVAHHAAMQVNNEHKSKTGNDLTAKRVIDAFHETWRVVRKEVEDWGSERPADVERRAPNLINRYLEGFAGDYTAVAAEAPVCVMVGPVPVVGVIDTMGWLVGRTKRRTIVDYKVSSKAKTLADLASSMAMPFYAMAAVPLLGSDVDVGLCSFVKGKGSVRIDWVANKADGKQMAWFRHVALVVANSISLGNFPVTLPSNWWCSERFCGYWGSCRGGVKPVSLAAKPVKLTVGRR